MEPELCSSRIFSSSGCEVGEEDLPILPPHTKVVVTGNNRTKSVLVGLQGVVKKAVGLGGWHWLVLKNGIEVKLQRNALSVLEAPTGKEDDGGVIIDCDHSLGSCSSMQEKDLEFATSVECPKTKKPRVRHARAWPSAAKSCNRNRPKSLCPSSSNPRTTVNLSKLGTAALWRYWEHFELMNMNQNTSSKEQLLDGVDHHFRSLQLDELQVISGFIHTAKRLKTVY